MTKHGLWRYHKILKWKDIDFLTATPQQVHGAFYLYGDTTDRELIEQCVYRYMRRYKLDRTIEVWNSLCEIVGEHGNFYKRSIECAKFHHAKDSEYELLFDVDGCEWRLKFRGDKWLK